PSLRCSRDCRHPSNRRGAILLELGTGTGGRKVNAKGINMLCCQDASGRLDDHLVPVGRPQLGVVWRLMVLWLTTLIATALLFASPSSAQDEYPDPGDAFQISVAQQGEGTLGVHFKIAPGYYMYRKRFGFDTEPASDVLGSPV